MNCPDKIKKELKLKLEDLEGKKFEKSLFIDEEILKTISFITGETGYEVALVIDRKGNILDVYIKTKYYYPADEITLLFDEPKLPYRSVDLDLF